VPLSVADPVADGEGVADGVGAAIAEVVTVRTGRSVVVTVWVGGSVGVSVRVGLTGSSVSVGSSVWVGSSGRVGVRVGSGSVAVRLGISVGGDNVSIGRFGPPPPPHPTSSDAAMAKPVVRSATRPAVPMGSMSFSCLADPKRPTPPAVGLPVESRRDAYRSANMISTS
jgi:hypothetical protein